MPVRCLLFSLVVTLLSPSATGSDVITTQSASIDNAVNNVETEPKTTVAPPATKDSAKQLRKQVVGL